MQNLSFPKMALLLNHLYALQMVHDIHQLVEVIQSLLELYLIVVFWGCIGRKFRYFCMRKAHVRGMLPKAFPYNIRSDSNA
jgi:hypothetical protein